MVRSKSILLLFGIVVFGLRANGQSPDEREAYLVALARSAVVAEVSREAILAPSAHSERSSGVFVTIERQGRVVGCRGTLIPRCNSLHDEVVTAARSAAAHDPRYTPLSPRDLKDFLVTITIVDRLETMSAAQIESLAPGDGLVLVSGNRTGIVLPWEGKDPRTRLRWAFQKAGVSQSASCTLRRMTARRFRG